MRLQQLALRVSGDGQKLRFHERLTVISGISVEDRQGVVEVILGTLAGEPTVSSELAYVGRSGQRITVDQTAEGTFHTFHDDGTPAPPPSLHLGLSVHELFKLMYVDGRQLGHPPAGPVGAQGAARGPGRAGGAGRPARGGRGGEGRGRVVPARAAGHRRGDPPDRDRAPPPALRPDAARARGAEAGAGGAVVDVGRGRGRPGDGVAPRPAPSDRGPVAGGGPQAVRRGPGLRSRPGAARPPRAGRRA